MSDKRYGFIINAFQATQVNIPNKKNIERNFLSGVKFSSKN